MKLAIKGHPTRGKEVIKLLEILGGNNAFNFDGTELNRYYYIDNINDKIYHCLSVNPNYAIVFTLEEFEDKFPYKVGDKVIIRKSGIIYTISQMLWMDDRIIYLLDNCGGVWFSDELQPYKEENMKESKTPRTYEEVNKYLLENSIKNAQNLLDIEQCLNNDGMNLPDNINIHHLGIGSIEFIKWYESGNKNKPTYPKTYEECCDVLGMLDNRGFGLINLSECENILISHFIQLKRCRDAYWKIAGEQMGLGKPWEPDRCSELELNYTIIYNGMYINKIDGTDKYSLLAFPTEEMRDAFYENFKELIEECKELLLLWKKFKIYYRFPLQFDEDSPYIWTNNRQMAFTILADDNMIIKDIVNVLNKKSNIKFNAIHKDEIIINGLKMLLVRGWGMLTGIGGYNLDAKKHLKFKMNLLISV